MTDNAQTTRFVYTTNAKGRKVTAAYNYNDAEGGIYIATAECSRKDQFVKRIGRDVAFGRLVSKGGKFVPFAQIGGSKYGQIAEFVTRNVNAL